MVRVVGVLAVVNCGAGYVDSYNTGANNNKMSIQGLITGLVMLVAPSEEVKIADKVYKAIVLTDKAIIKSHEGTWGASAHEEGYQIVKDTIYKIGGLK